MFTTVLLLIACAIVAALGLPMALKLVPRNPYYGVRTEKTQSTDEIWYEANRFGGWALVIAAGVAALGLMMYQGTWLRAAWAQVLLFLVAVGVAVGATLRHVNKIKD